MLKGNVSAKGKGFKKGKTGNPGGRPKGFASMIRENTKNGKEIAMFMLKIMRGEMVCDREPDVRDSIKAAEWLADRGFGKSTETVKIEGELSTTQFSPSQIAQAGQLAQSLFIRDRN